MATPQPPPNFSKPKPRIAYIRPDKAGDIASLGLSGLLRMGAGVFVEGYRVKREDGKLVEYSQTLPDTRPQLPLHLFEFETCPFCRKVREVVTVLDLDVVFFPCPKGGTVYREYVKEQGGKAQFPYLEDPNSEFKSYESDDIIRYLFNTYGPGNSGTPMNIGAIATVSAGLASAVRSGKGRNRVTAKVPAKLPIELWGYEFSPFVKLVRETLNELELAHLLRTTARGSATRPLLKEKVGRFQVPYIVDPNTGIDMFESAEICEYLMSTYGPDAPGALVTPPVGSMYMPGDSMEREEEKVMSRSVNPQEGVDEALESYCEDNPEADECRVYEE